MLINGNDITKFKNIHTIKHAFIISSGPSLEDLDLSAMERRICFGLNRSFLKYEKAYYHCVMDERLIEQYPNEFSSQRQLFTIEGRSMGLGLKLLGSEGFSWDLAEGIYSGYTVSYFALQIAIYMGIKEIYFLGLDLKNTENKTHFFGQDYSSLKHDTTEYPKMIRCFEKIAPTLKDRGIRVFNCSKVSSLKCFPYMSYEDAIKL
ncbi:MAG: hypothetical protein H6622_10480 [Halobacteriovoraceae bacterium]|nr:hypothetical protein [Halobacteriovoraceae bacterium]